MLLPGDSWAGQNRLVLRVVGIRAELGDAKPMKKILIASAALVLSGSAYGADIAVKAPPMVAPVPASWTGLYVGINGGGVWGSADPTVTSLTTTAPFYTPISSPTQGGAVPPTGSNRINNSGGLFGAQVGYLWQSSKFVGGFEAAFDWMNARGSATNTGLYTGGSLGQSFTFNKSVSTNWLFTFLGRAGIDMGAWYPYLTGGVAVADLSYSSAFSDTYANPGLGAVALSQTRAAWVVGGGAEWKWNSHWSVRGEYLYMEFNKFSGNMAVFQSLFPANISNLNHDVAFKESVARALLSYRF
jgi:outer membrane immunogenic protein